MKKISLFAMVCVALSSAAQVKPVKKVVLPVSILNKKATVYTTAQRSDQRISLTGTLEFKPFKQPLETQPCIFIDASKTFQTFFGIGGALTDAAAETFAKLPAAKQEELLTAYYDKNKGIGYSLARTNMNSCDFSSDTYTYVADDDRELKSFNIAHDLQFKVPLIKRAMAAAGGKLSLFISPWSPPAWMKDNHQMLQGGKLTTANYQSWANYYIRFIQSLQRNGIPVWGLTVQNEPMAKQRWESCIYTAEEERDFIKNFLGPTLVKNGMADKKLMAWDHNRDLVYQRAETVLGDPQAAKYIWGLGYHWYETWTGSAMQFDNMRNVEARFPAKNLLLTEACIEKFSFDRLNDWSLGEKYGYSMINDFNSGAVGWTDWNVLLNENGGPNHVGNFCFAPVIADTRNGSLVYTNSYYYIGQFSKFIQRGAKRIISSANRDKLQTTAFANPDGSLAVVVLNTSDTDLPYQLCISGGAATAESKAHSISTLIVK